ncbi:MAG: DUF4395 domain-containing protein [Actinomycetota bacterium]
MEKHATMVDPRQPRLGQGITGGVLLLGFLLDLPAALPILAAVLGGASLLGPSFNLYAHLFRALRGTGVLGPPRELEEAAPPRFANTVGFVFLTLAGLAWFGFDPPLAGGSAAWGLGLVVSALALLAALTGLCPGCELYVWARRLATGGRVRGRLVRPIEEAGRSG